MIKKIQGSALLLATALLLPAFAAAQDADEGPQWLSVRTVTTTADGGDTWIEQQKKLAARHAERGDPSRHVWQEVRGQLDTFHIVTYPDSLGGGAGPGDEPPMGDAQDEWVATISPTVASRSSVFLRHYPKFTISADDDAEPAFLILRYTDLAPGKGADYQDWLENKLVPALKAGGAKGVNFNRTAIGGNTNRWVSGSRIANLAELDKPGPLAGLSDEERDDIFADFSDMVWGSELRILRYRADMSHTTPTED
jgi:hypothetical protein